jgi:hypothetical protein
MLKGFRPLRAESLFFACPKKSNPKKGHPEGALCGRRARKVRGGITGFFDRASCPDEKLAGVLPATLRAFLHPSAAP